MEFSLTFTDEAGATFTYSSSTVIVFIDETGHELLKDKQYPVFGLGGCLCAAKDYYPLIYQPWKQVEQTFDPGQLPLHASALRKGKMTDAQFKAINGFFATNAFARFMVSPNVKTQNACI